MSDKQPRLLELAEVDRVLIGAMLQQPALPHHDAGDLCRHQLRVQADPIECPALRRGGPGRRSVIQHEQDLGVREAG